MKKEYKDLEVEVVDFEAEDVITASGPACDPDKAPCPEVLVPICPMKEAPCKIIGCMDMCPKLGEG